MNYLSITTQTCAAAREAGQYLLQEFRTVQRQDIEFKGRNDLVSYVDKTAEKLLVARCQEILPEATFLTEEGTVAAAEGDWQWIIDPLDGTTNFLHGLPLFTVSIGLRYKGTIVVGVIYAPNTDECFYAWKDGGAYCNSTSIHVTQTPTLSDSLLATGFPYTKFDRVPQFMEIFESILVKSRGLRRLGSAALDLAYVAIGRFDGFFESGLSPWDVSAGILLVQEAGGQVSDYGGTTDMLFGKEIIASNPHIHPALLQEIKPVFRK